MIPDYGYGWDGLEEGDVVVGKNVVFLVLKGGAKLRLLDLETGRVYGPLASKLASMQPDWGEYVIRRRDVG